MNEVMKEDMNEVMKEDMNEVMKEDMNEVKFKFRKLPDKRRIRSAFMAFSLVFLSFATCISASKVYELSFNNTFSNGSVDIDLKQLMVDETGQKVAAGTESVMPGEYVSYMPEITNLRADAYVRVRIDFEMEEETEAPVTASDIFKISEGWVQKGEWFYNRSPMKKGESSIAFLGVHIPDNWVNDPGSSLPAVRKGQKPAKASGFTVKAHADAIQADNFNPDFASDMPWGPVITEEAKNTDHSSYDIADPLVTTNEMIFTGSGGLEANTKDLFRNFQLFMAGTEYSDSLSITNKAAHGITVYFRTKARDDELADHMKLKISLDERDLYSGSLTSQPLNKYKELIELGPGETADLDYIVSLPDESKNYYSVLADDVEWDFRVVENSRVGTVKTGDDEVFLMWLAAFGISLILLTLLVNTESRRLLLQRENGQKR